MKHYLQKSVRPAWILLSAASFTLLLYGACSDSASMDSMGGGAGDMDSDMDTDADTDADTDSDTDSDTDPPEEEEPVDYRVPQGSGRYVFIADQANDAVVVVDSETLVIDVVDVGARPTHLVPLAQDDAAAVIAIDSDEVTIIRVNSSGIPETVDVGVRPDTNALAVSNDGTFVIAFYDSLFAEETGPPGTDQEISVIVTTADAPEVFHMTVGMHPQRIVFNEDETRALVITEEGINIIDLSDLSSVGIPPQITMFDSTLVDPSTVEIAIDPTGALAVAREEGSSTVVTASLDGTADVRTYLLPGVPTDLDISPDGSFGLFIIRETAQAAVFSLPLPLDSFQDPFEYVNLGNLVCGVATITPDGDSALLHTTVGGDETDRKVLTSMTWTGLAWDVSSTLLERQIKSVAAGTDSNTAVVIHQPVTATYTTFANAYSLVNLLALQVKFQQIPVSPGQLLLTPDGGSGFLLLRDDIEGIRQTDIINMNTFIVDNLVLGSPPTASGYSQGTNKVFIAQDHPAGRMTFIGVQDGMVKTVTGYALNDEITD